jgi:hypothetical protein
MVTRRHRRLVLAMMFVSLAAGLALAQERGDPIGPITRSATFDRAQKINVGKTAAGKTACYFREEGSSHSLDIGLNADGAFMRLETGDSRETTPTAPLRIFAGKQGEKDGYATDEFTVLQPYNGAFEYYVPKPDQGDFVVVAKGDATAFFNMIARARMEFVVVRSAADPKSADFVAIYEFKASAIPALLSCAKARIQ